MRLLPAPPQSRFAALTAGPPASDLLLLPREDQPLLRDPSLARRVDQERAWLQAIYEQIFVAPLLREHDATRTKDGGSGVHCCHAGCRRRGPVGSRLRYCPFHREPLVSWESFAWGFCLARSRAMDLELGCNGDGPDRPASLRAILPVVDMANHSGNPSCELVASPQGVGLVARREHAAGEPLLLDYGGRCAAEMLRSYHFVCGDWWRFEIPAADSATTLPWVVDVVGGSPRAGELYLATALHVTCGEHGDSTGSGGPPGLRGHCTVRPAPVDRVWAPPSLGSGEAAANAAGRISAGPLLRRAVCALQCWLSLDGDDTKGSRSEADTTAAVAPWFGRVTAESYGVARMEVAMRVACDLELQCDLLPAL